MHGGRAAVGTSTCATGIPHPYARPGNDTFELRSWVPMMWVVRPGEWLHYRRPAISNAITDARRSRSTSSQFFHGLPRTCDFVGCSKAASTEPSVPPP